MIVIKVEDEIDTWESSPIRRSIDGLRNRRPDLLELGAYGEFDQLDQEVNRCHLSYEDTSKPITARLMWKSEQDYMWFLLQWS